jgi:hypothetical protein
LEGDESAFPLVESESLYSIFFLFREENDHINTLTNYGVYKELSGLLKKAKSCPEKAWM